MALADEQLAIARAWGAPGGHGSALQVRALVGPPAQAEPLLAEAVELLTRAHCRVDLARAHVDHGIALRRAGRRRDARAALEQGLELAARCEAAPLVTRARAELRVLGARPRRRMFSGVEGLTASEHRVAGMAAEGLTNADIAQALFVTRKTIETHLHSVFRKLGISSRRELAAALEPRTADA